MGRKSLARSPDGELVLGEGEIHGSAPNSASRLTGEVAVGPEGKAADEGLPIPDLKFRMAVGHSPPAPFGGTSRLTGEARGHLLAASHDIMTRFELIRPARHWEMARLGDFHRIGPRRELGGDQLIGFGRCAGILVAQITRVGVLIVGSLLSRALGSPKRSRKPAVVVPLIVSGSRGQRNGYPS